MTHLESPNPAAAHARGLGMAWLTKARFLAMALAFAVSVGAGVNTTLAQPGGGGGNAPPDTMLPLRIDEVVVQNGELVALGSLGDTTFASPLDLRLVELLPPGGDLCALLDLELGPIHLNLLGLNVDTSPICLLIAAEPGPGNLLGNLLCGIAGLLDDGVPLATILGNLDPADLQTLLDGLTGLLNGALEEVTRPGNVVGVSGTMPRHHRPGHGGGPPGGQPPGQGFNQACDILNLSVGPVELNLLGLVVMLDDCDGGPVTVDITAQPGPGNLLGNLLCRLAHLLDTPANQNAINQLLGRIANEILNLI